jgi:large subunit ribosomal protein L22
MEAKATARFVRMSPRKVRLVMDVIRGKYAQEALNTLRFMPNHASDEIANVIKSAVANAVNNHGMSDDYLKIARCYVDAGPTMKRVQPRAQGRAYRILKRTSHITVIIEEGQAPPRKTGSLRKQPLAPLLAKLPTPAGAAEAPAPAETVEERDETAAAPATDVTEDATPGGRRVRRRRDGCR